VLLQIGIRALADVSEGCLEIVAIRVEQGTHVVRLVLLEAWWREGRWGAFVVGLSF
jgi:hypothetical protein